MAMKDSDIMMSKSCDSIELTEALVLTRTRAPDLESVKKLNCWASNIGDVSVVRRMPGLEVCSLSINKITSLRDFAHCHNLKELYVRTNRIERLGDIHYLRRLRKLRSLWLSENPCAGEPNYRMTVLKTLPNLRKLDNIVVTEEEVHRAETDGDQIPIPEDFSFSSIFDVDALSRSGAESTNSGLDSARSVTDSARSVADSVESSIGASVGHSVVDSVASVAVSDGQWALPRRKRQQRKREEMLRSSGEEGGSSPRSGEESSGGGKERQHDVDGSSDSHTEEGNEGDIQKTVDNNEKCDTFSSYNGDDGAVNGEANVKGNTEDSQGSKTIENSELEQKTNGKVSEKDNSGIDFPYPTKVNSVINLNASNNIKMQPKFPPVPERVGSINILHISDADETCHNETASSSNSTLIPDGCENIMQEENNNISCTSQNINNNAISAQDNTCKTEQACPPNPSASASRPLPIPSKLSEHSLLDQIRLDDSLDVMDSAADEKSGSPTKLSEEEFLRGLEARQTQDQLAKSHSSGSAEDGKASDDDSFKISKPKPPVPIKTRAAHINWEEHNRLRAELGVKPVENTRSMAVSANTEVNRSEVTRARNSNILQAVLSLLKELDRDSLDIVGAAIKARVDSME